MILQNEYIRLRVLERSDLAKMEQWENDPSNWEFGNTIAPYTREMLLDYIQNYDTDIFRSRQMRFVIEDKKSGEVIGAVDLTDFDIQNRRVSLGVIVDAEYRGKGYATMSIIETCKYAIEFLGMHQCYALVATDNEASCKLFEKCGFVATARLAHWLRRGKNYVDVIYYQYFVK